MIDVKTVPLPSTPPTRTCNDSAYGSGIGATGLVANAVAGRKSEAAADGSRPRDGAVDDDNISDIGVHDDDAEFFYGIHDDVDDEEDDLTRGEHYDPLIIQPSDDVMAQKTSEGRLLSAGVNRDDATPSV